MRFFLTKGFGIAAGMLLLAAVLGGSVGLVAAKPRNFPLVIGQNYTGPVGGGTVGVAPARWLSCLPPTSWSAVYTWDGPLKQWYH
ncbi:MAG: hypothetical protein ACR2HN_10630, partial [Tepidiformaceae bacterium]